MCTRGFSTVPTSRIASPSYRAGSSISVRAVSTLRGAPHAIRSTDRPSAMGRRRPTIARCPSRYTPPFTGPPLPAAPRRPIHLALPHALAGSDDRRRLRPRADARRERAAAAAGRGHPRTRLHGPRAPPVHPDREGQPPRLSPDPRVRDRSARDLVPARGDAAEHRRVAGRHRARGPRPLVAGRRPPAPAASLYRDRRPEPPAPRRYEHR